MYTGGGLPRGGGNAGGGGRGKKKKPGGKKPPPRKQQQQQHNYPSRLATGQQPEEYDNDDLQDERNKKKPWWKAAQEELEYCEWQELQTPEGLTYYYNVDSGETTWDKPDALLNDDELSKKGDWVWLPDDEECFVPARIVGNEGRKVTCETNDGNIISIKRDIHLEPLNWSHLQKKVADLVLLDVMSAPLILHNLRKRFEEDQAIYTNIGTILISINPYQGLPLYTPDVINRYHNKGIKEMPPHVFAIAQDCLFGLNEFHLNQSMVISGESGAGKTEATKQALSFLAAVVGSIGNNKIEEKILLSNPILESFGNAKTIRNDNSSRFGKYIEVYMQNGKICGGYITNYLLEKIRVVYQASDERTFHIFYQLTEGAPSEITRKYHLGSADTFHYLNTSGCIELDTINDKIDFKETIHSMDKLGFSKSDQDNLFHIVACVLHIGNINFRDTGSRSCAIDDKKLVELAAKILEVETSTLIKALQVRMLKVPGQEATEVPLGYEQAIEARDALAKFLYDRMFDWIVNKINDSMKLSNNLTKTQCRSIGILDIFGFEIFNINSFEQLCINFANEKLQQLFNQTTFKLEEQVYESEGIEFQHVDFIDNQPVLDLCEKQPNGLLCILDEELRMPKGSDITFLSKAESYHTKKNKKYYAKYIQAPDHFTLYHYAGAVLYDTVGFLEKNRDTLTEDLFNLVKQSNFLFTHDLFPQEISSQQRKVSLGKQFRVQLSDLMQALHQTEPHYIRTVKPNDFKEPFVFRNRNVYEQLTYSGVFEAVSIRKIGYPFRHKHKEFNDRYKCIMKSNNNNSGGDLKRSCIKILESQNCDMSNVQVGRTMVLYRADIQRTLELQRSIIMVQVEMEEMLTSLMDKDPYSLPDPESYFEALSKAVIKANQFNIKTPLAERAREILYEYIENLIDPIVRQMLEDAKLSLNQEQLEYAVNEAEKGEWDTNLVRECKILLNRVKRINEEAAIALESLEERHMEICLNAANELGMNTDILEYFDQLFNHTDKETFIKEQMRAAVRLEDHARAIRITVRLKTIYLERAEQDFFLPRYSKMKLPEYWASEKLLSFKKEELANSMFYHTKDSIHATLLDEMGEKTAIADVLGLKNQLEKDAVRLFNNIQIFMDDRKESGIDATSAARSVLEKGLKFPQLRDEIYAQVMKQLSRNSNNNSLQKGWDMMGLLLITFPPQADFENYVHVFLRQNCPSDELDAYLGAKEYILYYGAKTMVPSQQEILQVREAVYALVDCFAEPLPEGEPSYQDILEPYEGLKEEDQVAFIRPTPRGKVIKPKPKQPRPKPKPRTRERNISKPRPGVTSGGQRATRGRGGKSNRGRGSKINRGRGGGGGNKGRPKPKNPRPSPGTGLANAVATAISVNNNNNDDDDWNDEPISEPQIIEEKKEPTKPRRRPPPRRKPPPKKKVPKPSLWKKYKDDNTGVDYYFNEETGESSWEPPPDFSYSMAHSQSLMSARGGWE